MAIDKNFFVDKDAQSGRLEIADMVKNEGNEEILWQGKPNGKSFVLGRIVTMMPVALIWLAFDGFAIAMIATFADELPWYLFLFFAVFFALHLTPVWIWIANIVSAFRRLKHIEYAFTDKRVIIKSGFFVKFDNIFYSEISSLDMHVGFIDRMFKVGDINIQTNSGSHYAVEDIDNPYFIQERLQKIVTDIKTDMQYPNDLRPEENHGYNTKYMG